MTQAEQFRATHDLENYKAWGVPFEEHSEGSGPRRVDYFSVDCTVDGVTYDCWGSSSVNDYEWEVAIDFPDGSQIRTGFTTY